MENKDVLLDFRCINQTPTPLAPPIPAAPASIILRNKRREYSDLAAASILSSNGARSTSVGENAF
jgi:hypothetical protein